MKCKYCEGNLSLEDAFCPHCGRPNEEARQHAADMKRYQGDFEDTRSDVYTVTRKYSGITARAVVIAILVVLILAVFLLTSNAYEIRRSLKIFDSARKVSQYEKVMEQYLEEEDFLSFAAFCKAHYIRSYSDDYENYASVISAAEDYAYLYDSIVGLPYEEYDSSREYTRENIATYFDRFYDAMEKDDFREEERNRQAVLRMEENVKLLLHTYCGLTSEEADNFRNLSKAERLLLLEERVVYENNAE